jgi:uncharacterized protein (DUF433 family)
MARILSFPDSIQRLACRMVSRDPNVVAAFTEEQANRLSGVSVNQLRYWDRTGFFLPSLAYNDRRVPYSRLYSFRDVACLKIINELRNRVRCTLPHLREVKEKLAHLGDDLWAKTTLYVVNRRVVFFNPDTDKKEDVLSGQIILDIPLRVVSGDLDKAVKMLRQRDASSVGKTERSKSIAGNQEVIAGTRIPVRSVKAFADAGYSVNDIKKEYPTLTEQDIRAAIRRGAAA